VNTRSQTLPSVRLGDFATFNPASPVLRPDEEATFVPMASVSEQGTMQVSGHVCVADLKSGYSYMQTGDVLVAKITPCFENKKIAVADLDRTHGFGSTEFHVIRATPSALDGRYLVHFLRQDSVNSSGERRMTGSAGQRRVPRQFFEELAIPLPSLDEQRRIAAILDQADDLRRKRREALGRLKELNRSIFLDMFGDPVQNRRGWPVSRLGAVGTLDRGVSKHRPRNDPALLGGAYPLIQTGSIANCDGYVLRYTATYSELGLKQSKLWPVGTLCITIAANIGKTGILTFDACFPDSVVGFTPNDLVVSEFVQQWFAFIQPTLEKDAPQFAQKNINLAILRDLVLPIPPLALQRAFAERIVEIDALKSDHHAHLAKLDALYSSLQHRAFRGEL
jgi:type I restriction enzyme S subunit